MDPLGPGARPRGPGGRAGLRLRRHPRRDGQLPDDISGQLDDDADGRGNRCDFDYSNSHATVTASLFNDMKASVGHLVTMSNCGAPLSAGGTGNVNQRCGEFDHDEVGLVISSNDFSLIKAQVGKFLGTKCAACTVGTGWSNSLGTGGERLGRPICQTTVPGACVYAP